MHLDRSSNFILVKERERTKIPTKPGKKRKEKDSHLTHRQLKPAKSSLPPLLSSPIVLSSFPEQKPEDGRGEGETRSHSPLPLHLPNGATER